MKKYLTLRADVSDLKEIFRDVLKEERVLTKADLVNIPTIKEIEKTLESYPTKDDLAIALEPITTEIKKIRLDMAIILGLKNQKSAFS